MTPLDPTHLVGPRKNALYKILLAPFFIGIITFVVATIVSLVILFGFGFGEQLSALQDPNAPPARPGSPFALAMMFGTIALAILPLWFWVNTAHGRSLWTLISPMRGISWPAIGYSALAFALISSVFLLISFLLISWGADATFRAPDMRFVYWFVPLTLLVFLQISAEELLCRGYLLQHLKARTGRKWVYLLLPSLFFGFLHFDPSTEPVLTWMYVATTAVWGLILADITDRTGTLYPALTLHFLNNWVIIFISSASIWPSDISIFITDLSGTSDTEIAGFLALEMILAVIAYIIWRVLIRKRGYVAA